MIKNVYSITLGCKYRHKWDGGYFQATHNILASSFDRAQRRVLAIAKKDSRDSGTPYKVLDVTNVTLVAQDVRS